MRLKPYLFAVVVIFSTLSMRRMCALLLVAGLLVGCGKKAAPPAAPVEPAAATYAGDAACASCHGDLYASYKRSGMGQSLSLFDAATAPERFPKDLRVYSATRDLYYTPFVRNDTLFQREFRLDEQGNVIYEQTRAADWVVGSGKATRSYLMNVNGYVTEMPLTWYVERGIWDLSPGYEQVNQRFSRPINEECMTCHNALPAHTPFTEAHYTDVPLGISCERCHGPGSEHVEARLGGFETAEGEADPTLVRLSALPRERQMSVCQQCHLSGTKVFKPGEGPDTFRPGEPLAENRAVFAMAEQLRDPERFGISSHAQRLALSACFDASAMTCTTCHDPHRPVQELEPDHYNQVCQSCHTPTVDRPDAVVCDRTHASAAMTGNCVSCHIQKSGTSDIPHVTFTDHWIRKTLPPARRPDDIERTLVRAEPVTLVRVTGEAVEPTGPQADVEEGMAYFRFQQTTHFIPGYFPGIKEKLRAGLDGGAEMAEARVVLGRVLLLQDSLAVAERVLADAVARYPRHADAQFWLGKARYEAGRAADALGPLREAVALQPALLDARYTLAQALERAGQTAAAEAAYRDLLARDPVHQPGAWNNLGFLLLGQQRLDDAATAFDRALALDPDLAVALVNLASLRLMQGDLDAGQTLLDRALKVEPNNTSALGNRALVAAQQGDLAEARRLLTRLLQITPGDDRARALLAQIDAAS